MKKVDSPWSTGALFICTKCGKSISDKTMKNPQDAAEDLKKFLKGNLKEKGLGHDIRVMTSSCLDVCEPEVQAVSYCAADGKASEQFTLHPEKDKEQLLKFLQSKIKS